jgi:hypothetical protein
MEGWVWLTVAGLAADIIGAWILAGGLFISNEEAVKLSVSRFAGESVEETSGCPPCRIA